MEITHLAYLGPASHKTVQGTDFPRDVPVAVDPRQAKSILRYWPASFVGLSPCPKCAGKTHPHGHGPQTVLEPQEAAPKVVPEQSEPEAIPDAPEAREEAEEPKAEPKRPGRPRKQADEAKE